MGGEEWEMAATLLGENRLMPWGKLAKPGRREQSGSVYQYPVNSGPGIFSLSGASLPGGDFHVGQVGEGQGHSIPLIPQRVTGYRTRRSWSKGRGPWVRKARFGSQFCWGLANSASLSLSSPVHGGQHNFRHAGYGGDALHREGMVLVLRADPLLPIPPPLLTPTPQY